MEDRVHVPIVPATAVSMLDNFPAEQETYAEAIYCRERHYFAGMPVDIWVADDVDRGRMARGLPHAERECAQEDDRITAAGVLLRLLTVYPSLPETEDDGSEVDYDRDICDDVPTIDEMWAKMEALGIMRD